MQEGEIPIVDSIKQDYYEYCKLKLPDIISEANSLPDIKKQRFVKGKVALCYSFFDKETSVDIFREAYPGIKNMFQGRTDYNFILFGLKSGLLDTLTNDRGLSKMEIFYKKNRLKLIEAYLEFQMYDRCVDIITNLKQIKGVTNYQRMLSNIIFEGAKNGWFNSTLYQILKDNIHPVDYYKTRCYCSLAVAAKYVNDNSEDYIKMAIEVLDKMKPNYMYDEYSFLKNIPVIVDTVYLSSNDEPTKLIEKFIKGVKRRGVLNDVGLGLDEIEEMAIILWKHGNVKAFKKIKKLINSVKFSYPEPEENETIMAGFRRGFFNINQGAIAGVYGIEGDYHELEYLMEKKFDAEGPKYRRKYAYYSALNRDIEINMTKMNYWYDEYLSDSTESDYDFWLIEILHCIENSLFGLNGLTRSNSNY